MVTWLNFFGCGKYLSMGITWVQLRLAKMYEQQLVQSRPIYQQSVPKRYRYELISANYQKVSGKKRDDITNGKKTHGTWLLAGLGVYGVE